MKILLVGLGWVGNKMYMELIKRGHVVITTSHADVYNKLRTSTFDRVVNTAGVTGTPNVDACELNKLNTYYGNTIYPIELHEACKVNEIPLSHFSSGCIYEGHIDSVDADPNFFGSTYSISKGLSDTYLKHRAQVFRIRMPFTAVDEPKNFLSKIIKYGKTGKLYEGGLNSLTYLDDAIRVACNLIETNAPNGAYNLVNNGAVTMADIVKLLGIEPEWFTEKEFTNATLAKRSNCVIPAYKEMRDIQDVLPMAISYIKRVDNQND